MWTAIAVRTQRRVVRIENPQEPVTGERRPVQPAAVARALGIAIETDRIERAAWRDHPLPKPGFHAQRIQLHTAPDRTGDVRFDVGYIRGVGIEPVRLGFSLARDPLAIGVNAGYLAAPIGI